MKIALIGTVATSILGFRRDLVLSLIARGHSVYAFASDYDQKTMDKVRGMGAVPICYKMGRSSLNPFVDALNTLRLASLLRKISPDLVFSYFVKPVIYGTVAAVLARVKRRIGMIEGLGSVFTPFPGGLTFKGRFIRRMQIMLYGVSLPHLERLIFLNADDPADLLGVYGLRTMNASVLGGIGVNLDQFKYSSPPTSPVKFVFVGRLLAEKGVYEFISAAEIIKREFPSAVFSVLGAIDSESKNSLKLDELARVVASGVIEAPGHVEDVAEWLSDSSVFVLPSFYREGVPRSTQEAMAIGRAVITTNSPGCRETVDDGVNGFLIPPHSVIHLVEKMRFFLLNPSFIGEMGRASRTIAERKFDSREVNGRLVEMLEGL